MVKDDSVLILKNLACGEFVLTFHAQERMNERFVVVEDIRSVATTAESIIWQNDNETYLIKGDDLEGHSLFVVADVIDKIVIVTVFYEEGM